jgi:hypothetical protein
VIVYGAVSPCDGDWYGGINVKNCNAFLNALLHAEVMQSLWQNGSLRA